MATWDTKDYGFGGSTASSFSKANKDYSGIFDSSRDRAFSNAWRTGFDADGGGRGISDVFESLFDKARKKDKYRLQGEREDEISFNRDRAFGGELNQPRSGQILDNLGVVYPQQFSPMYIPGQPGTPGKKGLFGDIGSAAGMLGTAFGVFGPLGAPIGALAGSFVDRATS